MRLTALLLAFALGAAPAAAAPKRRAATPAASETESSRERTARAHFTKAERAFTLGKFKDALTSYQLAYEAMPLPAFLFNIAQCHRNLRNHEQAVFFLERYLTLEQNPPNLVAVQELIAEEKRKTPAKAPSRRPALATAPEDHEPSAEPEDREVDLSAPPPSAEKSELASALVAEQRSEPSAPRWWIWGAVGAAVIGGVAAIYLVTRDGSTPKSQLDPIDARR